MAKTQCLARVREVRHDIPNVISIDFERCAMPPITSVDDHIKIVLPFDGSDLRQPVSDDAAQPLLRTYTRRRWFKDGSWGIDVLEFGPEPGGEAHHGPGARWSQAVQPGDQVTVRGPGGHWQMPGDISHLLAVADAVALPAVANALAALPTSAQATIIRVDGHHSYPLTLTDRVTVVAAPRDPERIVATVRDLDLPHNTHAFVHGEAAMVRPMRRHLRLERGIPKDRVHLSAYWFAGRDADGWRAMKQDFNRSMEAESGD